MPHAEFVHLHQHTQYSLLDGACHLERLVAKARDLKMPALAVTDHGNMFGAVDFYGTAQHEGVKPIVGCEIYMAPGSRFEKSNQDGSYEGANHVTVLARDRTGYKNLMKLVTAGFLEGFYYKPRVDKTLFAEHHEGLVALSGCLNSEVARLLAAGDLAKAREVAGWYREVLGKDNYFMEIQYHGMPEQREVNRGIVTIARDLGIPLVATNDVHYLTQADVKAHEVLLCIQTGKTMKDKDHWRFSSDQFYFKSPAEMAQVFGELPEALKNTLVVAERCNLQLAFGQLHLPRYQVPPGYTLDSYLRELTQKGLKERYGHPTAEAEERLERELTVIERMGYAGYFLVVWDFISFAKSRGVAVGPGRGSAAGSLVAYCLGITYIDPLRYGLIFERFLNPERVSMPDMDIDFSDDRRDEVIEYVTAKYGAENVAQIITFGTMGAKAVIRDVGRALGMAYGEVDKIAKMVPNSLNILLDEALPQSPPLAEAVRTRPEVQELWQMAKALEGLTRHASTHAAGVVISNEPLQEHIPLYKGTKGEITTQYAMGAIEKIGLLKMDFLGLRTLTVISNTLKLVEEDQGTRMTPEDLPLDDAATFRLLGEVRTTGVFQLESAGMRDLLRRLKPERLEDIIALVALYRPGPMVMIDDFIARRHGRVKVTSDHPLMESILEETYGIMVYQEQVMRIASELAGFTMGEADVLRRAMGKKDPEMMDTQRKKFIDGASARGVSEKKAEKIFDQMAPFAGYAFNKSHAAAYAVLAYQTAYLKTHYPVGFMAALLSSEAGDTDKIVKYIEECRQMGIEVLPPDVNESGSSFRVVKEKIRFGLGAVKNVGETAIHSILTARQERGPFRSLFDFCARVDLRVVNKRVVESLIKCGAFDSLGASGGERARLFAAVDKAMEAASSAQRDRAGGQVSFLDILGGGQAGALSDPPLPEVPPWSPAQLLAAEKETLGFYVTGHPLAEFQEVIRAAATTTVADLASSGEKATVRVAAIVTAVKEITTKAGERMAFVTLEDLTGTVETIAFPELYRGAMLHLVKGAALLVTGQVDVTEEAVKILLSHVQPLAEAADSAGTAEKGRTVAVPVEIRVSSTALSLGLLQEIRAVVDRYPGSSPVRLHLETAPGTVVTVEAAAHLAVQADGGFLEEMEKLLGPGGVALG